MIEDHNLALLAAIAIYVALVFAVHWAYQHGKRSELWLSIMAALVGLGHVLKHRGKR